MLLVIAYTQCMRRCRGFSVYIDMRSKPLFQTPSPIAPSFEPLKNAFSNFGETLMGFGKSLNGIGADHPDFETTFGNGVVQIRKNFLPTFNALFGKLVQNTMTGRKSHEKFTSLNYTNSSGDCLKLILELRMATNDFFRDQNINLSKSQQVLFYLNGTIIKRLVNAVGYIFQLFFGSGET